MQDNPTGSPSSKRGIIIVDSSALTLLTAPVDPQFRDMKKEGDVEPRYSDILVFLSKHGYEIVIPEMVAIETGDILRNGGNVNSVFGANPHPIDTLRAYARPLLTDAAHGVHDHIRIVPPDARASSSAASWVRDLWRGYQLKDRQQARDAVKMLRNIDKDQFGDMAAVDMVTHMPSPDAQIFYLADDKEAFGNVRTAAANRKKPFAVGQLNLKGLLVALERNHLLDRAGLHKVTDVQDILTSMATHMNNQYDLLGLTKEKYHIGSYPFIDSTISSDMRNDYAFQQSLKGLDEEIKAEEEKKRQDITPPAETGMQKFQKKFGDWRSRSGKNAPDPPKRE